MNFTPGRRDQRELAPRIHVQSLGEPLAEHCAATLSVFGGEAKVAGGRVLANGRDIRDSRSCRRNPLEKHTLGVVVSRGCEPLREHEGRGSDDARIALHARERRLPVVDLEIVAEGEDAKIGAADENFLAEIRLHSRHHAIDDDERAHAHQHAADGDHADEGEESRTAAAAEVTPGDRQLEPAHSGRIVGKRITLRICDIPERYMNSRSIPMPTPPMGGIPCSIARR